MEINYKDFVMSNSPLAFFRRHQGAIAQITLAFYITLPGVTFAEGIAESVTQPLIETGGNHAPVLDQSANGVTVIKINKASAGGVSRNSYERFNVDSKGVIFNNATKITKTDLAGYIDGNARLGGRAAKVILNEVLGNDRSMLNGYMEIAGQKAQLVIANRRGITCNGCGFINTTRGVLTTGEAIFEGNKLDKFVVADGDVLLDGAGLNSPDTEYVDILARSIKLNGELWANNATLVTGQNTIDYARDTEGNLDITKLTPEELAAALSSSQATGASSDASADTSSTPSFALDVAAIGGMYANRITLIGTEKGLGVNFGGNVVAAEDMTLLADGRLVNKATLKAENIQVAGFSNDTGVTKSGELENQGQIHVQDTLQAKVKTLTNQQEITAKNIDIQAEQFTNKAADDSSTAQIKATDSINIHNTNTVTNQGKLVTNTLAIDANSVTNEGNKALVIAKQDLAVKVTGDILNKDGGVFYSFANGTFHANGDFINSSATVETEGDLAITATDIVNKKTRFKTATLTNIKPKSRFSQIRILTPYLIENSESAYLLSGNNFTLLGNINNQYSVISAIGNIDVTSDSFINKGYEGEVRQTVIHERHACPGLCSHYKVYDTTYNPINSKQIELMVNGEKKLFDTHLALAPTTFTAGGAIKGKIGSVTNTSIIDNLGDASAVTSQVDNATQSSNDLADLLDDARFSIPTTPDRGYLIETDPDFAGSGSPLSSSVLLQGVGNGANNRIRLGDGYYEQQQIRQQILELTGKQHLPNYQSTEALYQDLMVNALDQHKDLQLSVGLTLTATQIAALKKPIVWMVEQTVQTPNGPVVALVPKVFFPSSMDMILRPDGSLIAGSHINLEVEELNNTGSLVADKQLNLTSGTDLTITGNGTLQGEDIAVAATNDLTLTATKLKAQDQVNLTAGNNVTLASEVTKKTTTTSGYQRSRLTTVTNDVVELDADSIQIQAGNTFTSQGAQINASDDIAITAEHIDLLAVKDVADYSSFQGGGGNSTEIKRHRESITGTTLNAGDKLKLNATGEIFSKGSNLNGDNGIELAAGGEVVLATETATQSDYKQVKTKKKRTFGTKRTTTTTSSKSTTNQGTELTSNGDIKIVSGSDVTLYGSTATTTDGDIDVEAEGDVNLLAAVDQTSSRYQYEKKGSFRVKNKDQGSVKQTAVESALVAGSQNGKGGDITVKADDSILLEGATLDSSETLALSTKGNSASVVSKNSDGDFVTESGEQVGNVTVSTQELHNQEWNQSSSGYRGIAKDLMKGIAAVASVVSDDVEIKIGEAHETRREERIHKTATLVANDLEIDAQNDVTFVGTDVQVANNATINANDVIIDAAKNQVIESESHTTTTVVSGDGSKQREDRARAKAEANGETYQAPEEQDKTSLKVAASIIDHTETHTTDSTTWQGTNLSAGNLTINANDDVSILASDLVVEDNLAIKADDVTIGDRQDVIVTSEEEITKTTTFSLEVKNAYADVHHAERALNQADKAVRQAKRDYDSAKQLVKDGRLPKSDLDFYKANIAAAELNRVNAAVALASTVKAAAKTAATSAGTGFYASVGVSTQTDKSKTSTTESISNGSSISVGGNATLTSQDDLIIKGSSIQVDGELNLDAQDTQILAGQNTTHTTTESSSHGANASVTNSGSVSVGVNANQANSASQSKTHTNSQISAGTIASNSDSLSIKGANVHADDIQIHTDNLEIASLQNTSSRESQSAGGHIGFGSEGFVPDSYGVNMSKGEAERNWVDQQTTLTGENVNIQAKDTTVTGATIAAIDENGADNGNLSLTTDNLVVENITDIDNAKDMSIGYSTSWSSEQDGGSSQGSSQTNGTASNHASTTSSTDENKKTTTTNTYSASFTGHEKEQITKATLGSGNITVGGESIDNDSQFDDLNRDITETQQITKDMQRGGLNASVTIDSRTLSAEGWEDIANDVVDSVDYFADEIATMGNNLPEELRATLGANGEAFIDALIRGDLPAEEREAILQDEKLLAMLQAQHEIDSLSPEEKARLQAEFASRINALANDQKVAQESGEAFASNEQDSRPIQYVEASEQDIDDSKPRLVIEITSGADPYKSNPLAQAVAGLGKAQQAILALQETNPQAAQAIMIGLNLATGGPVKKAVEYTIEKAAEVVASMSETAQQALAKVGEAADYLHNLAGSFIQGMTIEQFKQEIAYEEEYPDSYKTENGAPLGSSPTDIKDGIVLGSAIVGIGSGLAGGKKGGGSNSQNGGEEDSSEQDNLNDEKHNQDYEEPKIVIPGRVQSRINLQTGTNKFGMKHILKEHLSGKPNKSQFHLSETDLKDLLQSKKVVHSPVVKVIESKTHGNLYVRQVNVGRTIGTNYLKDNNPTTILTVQSDKFGNIITAFPGL
ncbi:filamentous hemagglutinin N-terminal domain-containing protein [Marinomonas agarivorans]|nr:filamentous hemagglutinin N-terminal domain-containing protein [Marinomonas agarivorans]